MISSSQTIKITWSGADVLTAWQPAAPPRALPREPAESLRLKPGEVGQDATCKCAPGCGARHIHSTASLWELTARASGLVAISVKCLAQSEHWKNCFTKPLQPMRQAGHQQ